MYLIIAGEQNKDVADRSSAILLQASWPTRVFESEFCNLPFCYCLWSADSRAI